MRVTTRAGLLAVFVTILQSAAPAGAATPGKGAPVNVSYEYGPRRPQANPVLPGLNAGRGVFHGGGGESHAPRRYEPTEGDSFRIRNGSGLYNYTITDGVWYLQAGDRPGLRMSLRGEAGSYAVPALLPGLGICGDLRLAVSADGKTRWLDAFETIDAVLSPGSVRWECRDREMGVEIEMTALPFVDILGYAATARVLSSESGDVLLTWVFGSPGANRSVQARDDYLEIDPGADAGRGYVVDRGKYTRVYCGVTETPRQVGPGEPAADGAPSPAFSAEAERPLGLVQVRRSPGEDAASQSRFVCVWGYRDYDRQAVEEAYDRLPSKPFGDPAWVERMKANWFEHWVGRGLDPEEKFQAARGNSQAHVDASVQFWNRQRSRVRVSTPDPFFDNVINNTAAALRRQFEYPAFCHGVGWLKYGKINCGYYGHDLAGYHEEVRDSLLFLSGTLDLKGRPRYFEPVFTISSWCEEQGFHYVDQVWTHYCNTADLDFLKAMYPSVLRVIDHTLSSSDPDGDGMMTAYYEQWNCDGHGRGGNSVIWTGMAEVALRAVEKMAAVLGGTVMDRLNAPVEQFPRNREFADHFRMLRERTENALHENLWSDEVGAYCSGEWNGDLRVHPEAMEQSWFIRRGIGDPLRNYMAMRYVHENLHIEPVPGVTLELMNDWWPVTWSNHYVANGDSAYSVSAAFQSGAGEMFWPVLKTITETAYRSGSPILYHSMTNSGAGNGMTGLIELEPMVMAAVIEGVFGVHPRFGENLLILRPNLPRRWPEASIETEDYALSCEQGLERSAMRVRLPRSRRVRAEAPVRSDVQAVTVNGEPTSFTLETAVGACRVVIKAQEGAEFLFEVAVGPEATVAGSETVALGKPARFEVAHAVVAGVHDPQGTLEDFSVDGAGVSLRPAATGKRTVFLELEAGAARWLHPLNLDVAHDWEIAQACTSAYHAGGPAVVSPRIDETSRTLVLDLETRGDRSLGGPVEVEVAGAVLQCDAPEPGPRGTATLTAPLGGVWDRLSPGAVPVQVHAAGQTRTAAAVFWNVGDTGWAQRQVPLDLTDAWNADITRVYSQEFRWRHDYTGCGIGIDWRDPAPLKDARGYVLMTSPIDQFEYQTLPEGFTGTAHFEPPEFSGEITTPFGLRFSVGSRVPPGSTGTNLLALAATEPYEQLPSQALITMQKPLALEKIYLLTANLTKTAKSYHPGAEVVIHYEAGDAQTETLAPPYNMPCFGQHFCPTAAIIPFGEIVGDITPLRMGGCQPHLAVTDIVADPSRQIAAIELRCVSSETLFGVMGITGLRPPGR